MRVVPQQRNDVLPATDLKPDVDALRFSTDLLEKLLVARNVRAAGSADLYQREAAQVNRIHFQEAFHATEALDDSLGVVQAIDTDGKKRCFDSEFGTKCASLFSSTATWHALVAGLGKRHTNGIGAHPRDVALAVDGEAVPLRHRFQCVIHRFQEIVAVRLDVETDQVGS